MEQVIQAMKRNDAEKRIPVVRLEIDYELVTLHDYMVANDEKGIEQVKLKLKKLTQELLRLEG
ncbi:MULTISPECIES: hypothetical protein [Geomicrobium]|uniref:Uncharacterized protein n=1 Tax=Geomicrobium sediminis TaxID=1347788 RepID=A0ABS2PJC3_9BACL|nr:MULTISPECIES: hypothetical protein [Geomicrobium]MBM7635061.1 hypothetical protein [Geomicrobium sediminis]GAJ99697.1 hypothetical protein JCM19055_2724 [Geomicrobium sp. JCM 19055]GAK07374.1 hypothetical protein JCM19038_1107 [Geomicrobium sp. JCM 19038]